MTNLINPNLKGNQAPAYLNWASRILFDSFPSQTAQGHRWVMIRDETTDYWIQVPHLLQRLDEPLLKQSDRIKKIALFLFQKPLALIALPLYYLDRWYGAFQGREVKEISAQQLDADLASQDNSPEKARALWACRIANGYGTLPVCESQQAQKMFLGCLNAQESEFHRLYHNELTYSGIRKEDLSLEGCLTVYMTCEERYNKTIPSASTRNTRESFRNKGLMNQGFTLNEILKSVTDRFEKPKDDASCSALMMDFIQTHLLPCGKTDGRFQINYQSNAQVTSATTIPLVQAFVDKFYPSKEDREKLAQSLSSSPIDLGNAFLHLHPEAYLQIFEILFNRKVQDNPVYFTQMLHGAFQTQYEGSACDSFLCPPSHGWSPEAKKAILSELNQFMRLILMKELNLNSHVSEHQGANRQAAAAMFGYLSSDKSPIFKTQIFEKMDKDTVEFFFFLISDTIRKDPYSRNEENFQLISHWIETYGLAADPSYRVHQETLLTELQVYCKKLAGWSSDPQAKKPDQAHYRARLALLTHLGEQIKAVLEETSPASA